LIDKAYLEGSTYGNLDLDCMSEHDWWAIVIFLK